MDTEFVKRAVEECREQNQWNPDMLALLDIVDAFLDNHRFIDDPTIGHKCMEFARLYLSLED